MKYIFALDKNQISTSGIDLNPFVDIASLGTDDEEAKASVPQGFKKYDDALFFKEEGIVDNKRFVIGFNPELFKDERNLRNLKIHLFDEYLQRENGILKNAQKSRKAEPTKNRVNKELKRLKIKKYNQSPVLHETNLGLRAKLAFVYL